ncbi:MAG TPA: hypothetical protein VHZ55_01220 [Bryobacteraceae bacterium]|nr:hypothetical protein [Bryobacteraceae bacterium]
MITLGTGGKITGAAVTGAKPYDGSDDALIGVINNTGATFTGSFKLSGSGNGGGLFAFDGDGICSFITASYCATAPSGYDGPLTTFSSINSTGTTGTVNILGLAAGASTFFALESSPSSINGGGGPIIGGSTPEPATNLLLGGGILLVVLLSRRLRRLRRAP